MEEEKSVLPQLFNSNDRETFQTLKATTEQILMLRQETTQQLDKFAKITENVANIAKSAAAIRISDNNVLIMSQQIAADKEKWLAMLTHTFSGRDKAINTFIEQIENGAKSSNNEIILKAMDGLATIVASSPWPSFDSFNKLIDSGEDIELF